MHEGPKGGEGVTQRDDVGMDGARSAMLISLYNCPQSVVTDTLICSLLRNGKTFVVKAPALCPTCRTPRPPSTEMSSGSVCAALGTVG